MTDRRACIVGAFEHPTRHAPDTSLAELHAEVARGALADAGIEIGEVDGYFCAGDVPGWDRMGSGPFSVVEYLGLRLRHLDTTEGMGAAYVNHVAHAADAIALGRCAVALITLAGRPRSEGVSTGTVVRPQGTSAPELPFEAPYRPVIASMHALCAARHMYEFGTTAEDLAWIRVAASHHAAHNPHALLRERVGVRDVLDSPMIADPLRRLDCCVVSDGGGALVMTSLARARTLKRPLIGVRGAGFAVKHPMGGRIDLTATAAAQSAPRAFAEAKVRPEDIKYASLYDSFTITLLLQLEDLGFCPRGQGGRFVRDGGLIAGTGRLPVNTDGGGLCSNHPGNRGGMTKAIEAVRQLRGEAAPAVQVPDCDLALVQAIGGQIASRHASATLILERLG